MKHRYSKSRGTRSGLLSSICLWFAAVWFLLPVEVRSQIVWIPSPHPSQNHSLPFSPTKPIVVTYKDGRELTVTNAQIETKLDDGAAKCWGFTNEELGQFLLFQQGIRYLNGWSRSQWRKDATPNVHLLIPGCQISRVVFRDTPGSIADPVTIHFHSNNIPPLKLYADWNSLRDIGQHKANTRDHVVIVDFNTVSIEGCPIKEIAFATPKELFFPKQKSRLTATVIDIAGTTHRLTDVRIPGGQFSFLSGTNTVILKPEQVDRISIKKIVYPSDLKTDVDSPDGSALCEVILGNGLKESLLWIKGMNEFLHPRDFAIVGKEANRYIVLPVDFISTADFTESRHE